MMRLFLAFYILAFLIPARPSAATLGGPVITDSDAETDTTLHRPTIEAIRLSSPITIDGTLSESAWQRPGITKFTQRDPQEGASPTQRTEVWVAYDDAALYIAARMFDSSPDSIVRRIARRDADLSSDWFYVGIDSYHDRRSGFYFGVYASGAITDGTLLNDDWDNSSWDGVWDAATTIDDKGWTAELRIPFSQLRFPRQDEYVWGINFARQIERNKERDDFVLVPKKESGWVSRFADLTGIRDIHPPTRLEVLPYVVSGSRMTNEFDPRNPFRSSTSFNGNVGADLRVGLGSNLTLNATINPDFGQVEVDPAVVNLSQFETFYDEKRPFFVDGADLFNFGFGGANNNWGFNWGNPEFFYSRRVGRAPQGTTPDTGYANVPDGTTILGASKLTGKITDGWSLALMQALTEREQASLDDGFGKRSSIAVEPFSSYNVVRSQREFNKGRQAIGVIGTAVIRDLNETQLVDIFNKRSYAFGVDGWTNLDNEQNYVITGWLAASRVEGTPARMISLQRNSLHSFQRPDSRYVHVDSQRTSLAGYAGRIAVNKQKGNFSFNTALGMITPGFDSNDMGFLFRTDVVNAHVVVGYNWFEPDGFFRRKFINFAAFRSYTFSGGNDNTTLSPLGGYKIGEGYFMFFNGTFMNYWSMNGNFSYNPAVLDVRSTRGGPMMKNTSGYSLFTQGQTDGRSSMVFSLGLQAGRTESGGYRFDVFPGLQYKPTSGISISVTPEVIHDVTIAQWVTEQDDPTAAATYGGRYIFGKLDQWETSGSIRLDWTFTPRLSLQIYAQPLISVGSYSEFKELKQPGTYTFNRYGVENGSTITQNNDGSYAVDPDGSGANTFTFDNPDFNFKSLRGNAVLRWEYLPGSTLYLVWTRGQSRGDHPGNFDFRRDFSDMLNSPDHQDAIMLKVAYWWQPKF